MRRYQEGPAFVQSHLLLVPVFSELPPFVKLRLLTEVPLVTSKGMHVDAITDRVVRGCDSINANDSSRFASGELGEGIVDIDLSVHDE